MYVIGYKSISYKQNVSLELVLKVIHIRYHNIKIKEDLSYG